MFSAGGPTKDKEALKREQEEQKKGAVQNFLIFISVCAVIAGGMSLN